MEATIEVTDKSQVAEVRRVVIEIGKRNGMSEADVARAALVATESASNQVKYGKRGTTVICWFEEDGAQGIQIIALDQGPGFTSFVAAARDGYSTGGSLGFGLGTIMRNSDVFDHFTLEKAGTALFARIHDGNKGAAIKPGLLSIGSRMQPKPGQTQCGDGWASKHTKSKQWLCLVDGLGHGPLAAGASAEATRSFMKSPSEASPAEVMEHVHAALRSTRGAVVAIACIDPQEGTLTFAGVGNINAVMVTGEKVQHIPSSEGTVGYVIRRIRQHRYKWKPQSTLIMNTDGLSNRWNLAKSPGLMAKHPALIAAILHRDFSRHSDDSAIVVAKAAV